MVQQSKDPEVQLAIYTDELLRELTNASQRFIRILSEAKAGSRSADILSWEIETLRSLAELARRGLSNTSCGSKLCILDGINTVCAKWIEVGFSDEFLRAITIRNWTRIDMPSVAVN